MIPVTVFFVAIVSCLCLAGYAGGGVMLRRINLTETARVVSFMLFCTAIEIAAASGALFLEPWGYWWMAVKCLGRGVELYGVARFLLYLSRREKGL